MLLIALPLVAGLLARWNEKLLLAALVIGLLVDQSLLGPGWWLILDSLIGVAAFLAASLVSAGLGRVWRLLRPLKRG